MQSDTKKLINKKDKIFIAGKNGMVGSAVFRAFQRRGYENLITPNSFKLNLFIYSEVKSWFELNKPDVVVLAAAKVGGIYSNKSFPADFLLNNLRIQNNVIELAWQNNVKRLLFLGSSCIYPKNSIQPIKEDYLLSSPLEKTNEAYAIAKIAGIKLCEFLRSQYGFDAISLMPTNLYGPKDNYNLENCHVLPALIRKFYEAKKNNLKSVTCWGSGKPLREFLHSDDLGEACVYALENWNPNGLNSPRDDSGNPLLYLNAGTGIDISIKELANLIADFTDFKGDILWDLTKPDGTFKKLLNISRIKSIGWEPKISLKKGIKKIIEDFPTLYEKKLIKL